MNAAAFLSGLFVAAVIVGFLYYRSKRNAQAGSSSASGKAGRSPGAQPK